jgi:2,3-bisphosphoglycerate-independent phosphoglycerate mutase
MFEHDKKTGEVKFDSETGRPKPKTSHSLNPVPVFFYDPSECSGLRLAETGEELGISSLAATCLRLLGYEPPEDYTPSIVDLPSA